MKLKPGTYLREPCVATREGGREASVAVRVARVIEHRKTCNLGRRGFQLGRRQHVRHRYGETADRPTVSGTPWTHVHILLGPGRSSCCPALRAGPPKPRREPSGGRTARRSQMRRYVAVKPTNKAGVPSWRSQWSEASHPRGNRAVPHVPDSVPDFARPRDESVTAAGRLADLLTSCAAARPKGGAGCVSAHVRICPGPPGKPGGYRCARHGQQLGGESPLSSQMTAKD